MSRRPQEPPRSVSRHHRPTSLKTSGIAAQLFKARRRCQKIRCAREFVATNQEFTIPLFCAAGAPARIHYKRFAKPLGLRLRYCCHAATFP
jgi:hypothetical protein